MGIGTKVLLITLAITLGLSGLIISVVSTAVISRETGRAEELIHTAVSAYFDHVDAIHQRVNTTVRLLIEEPLIRGYLEQSSSPSAADRESAVAQLREIFGSILQTELSAADGFEPAFYVLVDSHGKVIVVSTKSAEIEPLLEKFDWATNSSPSTGRADRQVWIGGNLYVAFGVPLRADIDSAPSHTCYVGFHINDAMLARVIGGADRSMAANLCSWFMINGRPVARAVAVETRLAHEGPIAEAIDRATPRDSGLAKRAAIAFSASGERFVGEAFSFTPAPQTRGTFAIVSSLDRALTPLHRIQRNIAIVTIAVVIVSIIASRILSTLIAKPVSQLVEGTRHIARGDFNVPIPTNRHDEFGQLARSFNTMANGLAQRDLIKDTFGKFVDPTVVEAFLKDPEMLRRGERRVQTILFSDLANFTALSEKLKPEDQVKLLNAHLGDAADTIAGLNGIVDKFIGDSVMAFWGPPLTQDHAKLACRAALWLVEKTKQQADACVELGVEPLRVRIGIATGDVVVGVIGSASKFNYTVMGDIANLSSRLEGLNKLYGTNILVSAQTAQDAGAEFVVRKIDTVRVVGRDEPTEIFEVMGEDRTAENVQSICDRYGDALELYQSRDWAAARAAFAAILCDGASRIMAARCDSFIANNPGNDWDGIWNVQTK